MLRESCLLGYSCRYPEVFHLGTEKYWMCKHREEQGKRVHKAMSKSQDLTWNSLVDQCVDLLLRVVGFISFCLSPTCWCFQWLIESSNAEQASNSSPNSRWHLIYCRQVDNTAIFSHQMLLVLPAFGLFLSSTPLHRVCLMFLHLYFVVLSPVANFWTLSLPFYS